MAKHKKESPQASSKALHPWSRDALVAKAQRQAEEMLNQDRDGWQFGLWSTFVMESIARAALASHSPALLADAKDWNNLLFALGEAPRAPKFIARSIDFTIVMQRLRELIPEFTSQLEGLAAQHMNRRNEEVHTGGIPFDGLPSTWLAGYYEACSVLLGSMGEDLKSVFGGAEAKLAAKIISASKDESSKAVAKAVNAHKVVWDSKSETERTTLRAQADVWATRQGGHRVVCPSCGNKSLVNGDPIAAPIRKLDEDFIVETQEFLPARFECVACGLKISGLSQLSAVDLGATFKSTSTYSAADYYAPEDDYGGYEDDNNEPP